MFETNVECTIFWSLISEVLASDTNSYFYLLRKEVISPKYDFLIKKKLSFKFLKICITNKTRSKDHCNFRKSEWQRKKNMWQEKKTFSLRIQKSEWQQNNLYDKKNYRQEFRRSELQRKKAYDKNINKNWENLNGHKSKAYITRNKISLWPQKIWVKIH